MEVSEVKQGLKWLMVSCLIVLLVSSSAFATSNSSSGFSDVESSHWANESIKQMVELGVINGYDDGAFRPNQPVKRDEFSTMMVKSLNLSIDWNAKSSFSDMEDNYWAVPYVETAKYYLTGYNSGGTILFKPQSQAVREDMAVALVKALGYENTSYNDDVLDQFEDGGKISSNLKKYVAIAVEKGIMNGSKDGSKLYFNPVNALTRAESAVLLNQVIEEEKIVLDIEKVTFSEEETPVEEPMEINDYNAPTLSIKETDGKLKLTWNAISNGNLNGYKVVASKGDSTPAYPANGYKVWITDKSKTYEYVKSGDRYNSGDFGGTFMPGETYYFSITAVYSDKKVAGNVVRYTVPGESGSVEVEDYVTPKLTVTKENGILRLNWSQINHSKLNGYKVVASTSDSTPVYPENGYKVWITDKSKTYDYITAGDYYKNGDFSNFKSGETYYLSITAVYSDKKVAGNVVKITMP